MHQLSSRVFGLLVFLVGVLLMLCFPSFAHAHDGAGVAHHEFGVGFLHPLTGLDHLVFLVAVGFWIRQSAVRASMILPLILVSSLVGGTAMAIYGVVFSNVETNVTSSLAIMAVLLVFAVRLNHLVTLFLMTFFGLVHGMAHGLELPVGVSSVLFIAGLGFSSALVLGMGMAIATRLQQYQTLTRGTSIFLALSACLVF